MAGFTCFLKFHDGIAKVDRRIRNDTGGPTDHGRADFWVRGGKITDVRGSFDRSAQYVRLTQRPACVVYFDAGWPTP